MPYLGNKAGFNYTYAQAEDPALHLLKKNRRWKDTLRRIQGRVYYVNDVEPANTGKTNFSVN